MSLQLALIISFLVHLAVILIFPIIESPRIIHVSLPIELIPYTPPVEKSEPEVTKPETIRARKIKVKKEEKKIKKETTQAKEEIKKEEPKEILSKSKETPSPLISVPVVSIKTAEFPFTYYLSHIKKRVAENWYIKGHEGHYITVVYFKIHRDGKISDVKIRRSSGDFSFDRAAIIAIESAAPFLPLPDAYPEPSLGIYFEFQLKE